MCVNYLLVCPGLINNIVAVAGNIKYVIYSFIYAVKKKLMFIVL